MRVFVSVLAAAIAVFGIAQKGIDKQELTKLAGLDKAVATAKAALAKAPKDAAKKKSAVSAIMKAADAYLHANSVAPKVKYPKALRYYRDVLKIDPKHKEAKENVTGIEGIYKSMGRPIPK